MPGLQSSGFFEMSDGTDGQTHRFALIVPPRYDPSRRYQVRIQLHGALADRDRDAPITTVAARGTALPGDPNQFYLIPLAWKESPWWSVGQISHLRTILDRTKRQATQFSDLAVGRQLLS